jgi:hypothetical protein
MFRLRRQRLVCASVLALLPAALFAQQGGVTVSGRVLTDAGVALPGTHVYIEGLNTGVISQEDGRYTLTVPASQTNGRRAILAARRIGYKGVTVPITLTAGTSITQDFALISAPTQLEGIVVTALGIERDKRSLGVAQQTVATEELTTAKDPNILNSLSGKVSGVEITTLDRPADRRVSSFAARTRSRATTSRCSSSTAFRSTTPRRATPGSAAPTTGTPRRTSTPTTSSRSAS